MVTEYELRINNLVLNPNDNLVHKITVENISDIQNGYMKREPIPLTEEWLLKFGFIDEDLNMSGHKWLVFKRPHLHKMDIRISVPKNDNDWSVTIECVSPPTMAIAHIKHVNQLQNLYYALTQTELIIKQ
jgi:hypothetical protein